MRIEPAPLRDPVGERPLAQLGDEVGPPVGQHVRGVHGDDPEVREPPDRACLVAELLGGAALQEPDVEDGDGDPPVGVVLPGAVDVGVPLPTERGELPEPGQLRGLRDHRGRVAPPMATPSRGRHQVGGREECSMVALLHSHRSKATMLRSPAAHRDRIVT